MSEMKPTNEARDANNWAKPVDTMDVNNIPSEAINLNVQGRKPMSPLQGFGQLWQKTYRIRLEGVTISPQAVIKEWKAHFPEFWPDGNNFYGPLQGVKPGEVAVLNLAAHFGSPNQQPTLTSVCVDKKVQWSEASNIWHNAAVRTAVYMPVHLTKRIFNKG